MRFRVSRKLQENRIEIRLDQIRISFCFTVGFYFDRFYRRTRASATNAVGDLLPRSKQFARFFFQFVIYAHETKAEVKQRRY
jgi:hypothetical protein